MKLYHYALGIAAFVGATTAADAAAITYTVTGSTASGSPFSIVGTGETSAAFGFFGDISAVPTLQLTSNIITIGSSSGSITGGSLYFFDNHSVGVAGFNLNLSGDIFDFAAPQFSTFDAVTSLGPISVSQTYGPSFNTSFGSVNLSGATNLSFLAVVGGAVPEPSTWAMMLLGFAGIGLMLRRRQEKAGVPHAA